MDKNRLLTRFLRDLIFGVVGLLIGQFTMAIYLLYCQKN